MEIDFSDLATDFDAGNVPQAHQSAQDYLQAARDFAANRKPTLSDAKKADNRPVVACPKCAGTGTWVSFSGYTRSNCFKCSGTGKVRGLLQDAASVKAREQAAARRVTQQAAGQEAAVLWREEHADVLTWIARKADSFDFAASLQQSFQSRGILSAGQIDAVRRCLERDKARQTERQAVTATNSSNGGLDLTDLPAGFYAVPNGDTRLKVQIKKPDSGKWAGFIFVSDGAAYGQAVRYGLQAPDGRYRGKIEAQLTTILADPKAASAAYGQLTGHCGVCNRVLEDAVSVARGIGPICATKQGWVLNGLEDAA